MVMTAAEARTRGDATEDQRDQLRQLLQTKRYPKEWRDRFYADVLADKGLSASRAKSVIKWLAAQPNLNGKPIQAPADQVERILYLLRQRIAPGPWARQIRDRIDAGTLTCDEADHYLTDLERLPNRPFVAADGPRPGALAADAPNGYFALTGTDGRVRCYRVHTLNNGCRVVDQFASENREDSQIVGRKTGRRRRIPAWQAPNILRAVAADVTTAARLYLATRKRCSDCNQPLDNEDQPGWPHGIGPDCWEKRQAVAAAAGESAEATN